MSGGTWSLTDKPVRPGFYMNFIAAALAAIQPGARGILAIPVKANWGPVKGILEITSEQELIDAYGTETSTGFTAYKCIRLALIGGAKTTLGYRLVDGAAAKASTILQDTAATPVDVLTLATKHETTRDFKVTVRDNIIDSVGKQDIVLFEGTTQLYVFTFAKGTGVVDNAVAVINGDTRNLWLNATKVATGNDTLAAVANQALTGGNSGVAGITNADYTAAMTAFEARVFNSFALDGITDAALQTSTKSWVERLRSEGKKIIAYMGGSVIDDADITIANARSNGFNHEGVVNVGVSVNLDGVIHPSAEVACWVAGRGTGQALRESLTFANSPFDDVIPRLTHNQVVSAIQNGTLVLIHDGRRVKIECGINTLTSLTAEQNDAWKKIKPIRIMDAIDADTNKTAVDHYVGKVLNNEDGQVALLSAIKNYFETLSPVLLADDFLVETDAAKQATALSDEFFWRWEATLIDSMEKIFGTGVVR